MTKHLPAVAVSGGYELAEGARWVDGRLVFVDILAGSLYEVSPSGEDHLLARLDVPLGAVAPVAGSPGRWIAAVGTGFALLDPPGRLTWIDRPEDAADVPMRMNDGVCDPFGRFWAGSMAYDNTPGAGSLYRVDTDGTVTRVMGEMTIVNGPAFTPDGQTMYVTDTTAGIIYRCRLDAAGDVVEHEQFLVFGPDDGGPDGMTVDDQGRLWVALWDGWAVRCYEPDASLYRTVSVPAPRPTSVCLSGTGERRLLVTTARHGVADPSAASGAILSCGIEAAAPPACAFGTPSR